MFETIVCGTRRVLDFAAAAGARRLLLLSSGAVCGAWDPSDPRAVYANGKREAERLCGEYARQHGIACPIARGFAFVGPYLPLDLHFAIGNFIRDCLERRPIEIRGDGTPLRSYLYAADMAAWLWTILVRGQSGVPYDVGSERAISIGELAETVARALESPVPVRIAQAPRTGEPAERYVPETARARAELGLQECISLEDGIRRTAEWHQGARSLN
jgi:dTDP-glucose 4,6-dehydratase